MSYPMPIPVIGLGSLLAGYNRCGISTWKPQPLEAKPPFENRVMKSCAAIMLMHWVPPPPLCQSNELPELGPNSPMFDAALAALLPPPNELPPVRPSLKPTLEPETP